MAHLMIRLGTSNGSLRSGRFEQLRDVVDWLARCAGAPFRKDGKMGNAAKKV